MDEYISREETVKAFCEKCKGYYDGHCIHRGECDVDVIKTAPAADVQPVDRWISVNNRPEKDGKYLCYLESGNVCEAYYDSMIASEGEFPFGEWVGRFDSDTLGFIDTDWQPYDAITHWQPLPEPPKDGDTNG